MRFFHHLLESQPGVGEADRIDHESVRLTLPHPTLGEDFYTLNIDERDQRVLVIVDGDPLWGSIPKSGKMTYCEVVTTLESNVDHLRKTEFGEPHYKLVTRGESFVGRLDVMRRFFLLPASVSLFRLVRDKRSLGPMYAFARVTKTKNGPVVEWIKSSY